MAQGPRFVLPRLTTRSAILWGVGTPVVMVAILVYLGVTDPGTRPYLPLGVAPVLFCLALVFVTRVTVDTAAGTVTWRRLPWRTTRVLLAEATVVTLTPAGPSALLTVRTGRRGGHLNLLVLSDHVERSQAPEVLLALAGALETHVPSAVRGNVAADLRAQAKHLTRGGSPASSPLAARTSKGLIRAAGGIGAAGGGLGQL